MIEIEIWSLFFIQNRNQDFSFSFIEFYSIIRFKRDQVCCELLILAHFQLFREQLPKIGIETSLFKNPILLNHTIPTRPRLLKSDELLILAHFQSIIPIKAQLTRQKIHIETSLFENRILLDHTLPTSPHLLKSDELLFLALFHPSISPTKSHLNPT